MQIHLAELRNAPFLWDETVEVPAAVLGAEELVALGPVRWRGKVTAAEPGYYLRARLDVEQTLRCDRCLAPFTAPAGADVELLLVKKPARSATRSSWPRVTSGWSTSPAKFHTSRCCASSSSSACR